MIAPPGGRLQVRLFWRVVLSLLISVVLLAAFLVVRHQEGGARLSIGSGGFGGPVKVGAEFHAGLPLDTAGTEVTLLSARAVGVEPGLEAGVRLLVVPGSSRYSSPGRQMCGPGA